MQGIKINLQNEYMCGNYLTRYVFMFTGMHLHCYLHLYQAPNEAQVEGIQNRNRTYKTTVTVNHGIKNACQHDVFSGLLVLINNA